MDHRSIVKNTCAQIGAKIITSGVVLLATLLIASRFGADGFGEFTQVITFVSVFYLLVDFGLNALYVQKDEHLSHFQDLLTIRVLLGVILLGVSWLVVFSLPSYNGYGFSLSTKLGIMIYSFTILTQSLIFSALALFQKKLRYDLLLKTTILGALCTLFFIFFAGSLNSIYWGFLIGSIVTAAASLLTQKKLIYFKSPSVVFSRRLLIESLPLAGMLLFNMIYFRADIFILSYFRPAFDVGIYGYAYKYFDFLLTLPLFLSNSLYLLLVEEHKTNNTLSVKTKRYFLLGFLLSLVIVGAGWFLAPLIALVKSDFNSSVTPFRILLFSFPAFCLTSFFQWSLIAQKKTAYLLWVYIFSGILNILLNFLFIPTYGYNGAAVTTGLSEGAVLLFLFAKLFTIKSSRQDE